MITVRHGMSPSRANSRFVPSQWVTVLLCNDVSQWLGASLESALHSMIHESLAHLPTVMVTHIYASMNWASIGSDNGLSPVRHKVITWTNACLLSIRPLETNFSENRIKIQNYSFKKMLLKMSSAKLGGHFVQERGDTHSPATRSFVRQLVSKHKTNHVTVDSPSQRTSNAESASMLWCHHATGCSCRTNSTRVNCHPEMVTNPHF